MRSLILSLALTPALALAAPAAQADTLGPSSREERGFITRLGKGLFELGVGSLLVYTSRTTGIDESEASTSAATVAVGPSLRYFLIDNFALMLDVSALIAHQSASTTVAGATSESSTTEVGVLGLVGADYYLSLSKNMFFKPGLAVGGFWKSYSEPSPADPDATRKVTSAGGAGRVQLGLVYYTSPKFNLKAGLDVLALFGTRSGDGASDPDEDLFQLDLGWNVGFGYVF